MVPSLSSELRSRPARVRGDEVVQRGHDLVERLALDVVDGGRDEAALAGGDGEADVDGVAAFELVVVPVAVEVGRFLQSARDGFEQQHGGEESLLDGTRGVRGFEPAQRDAHVDARLEIVVRDLAIRSRHRGGDRAAHAGETAAWAGAGAGSGAGAACGAFALPGAAARSTSARSMAPPGPVPATVARSMPSSAATLRASGEACTRWASAGAGGGGGAGVGGGGGVGWGPGVSGARRRRLRRSRPRCRPCRR